MGADGGNGGKEGVCWKLEYRIPMRRILTVKAAPVGGDLGAPADNPVPPPRIKKPGSEALGAAFMGTT